MTLTKQQIRRIEERIRQAGVRTPGLIEDLVDHFCVAIEEAMAQGQSFQLAFEQVFAVLQEDELKITEMKTQELTEGKKIFYPDLAQSFALLLLAFAVGCLVTLVVHGISIAEEDVVLREQWLRQHYVLIAEIGTILSIGGAIGLALWQMRSTPARASLFEFRPVSTYVYGIIVLIAVFSPLWLEPTTLFVPFLQTFRETHLLRLTYVDPLLIVPLTIFNGILLEVLFRGIILRGLLMTMLPLRAILLSSLFCALLEFPFSPFYLAISLMHGWIYWKTRSLYPVITLLIVGIIAHYAAPLLVGYAEHFFYFSWWEYLGQNLMLYMLLVAGALLLTVGLLYYLYRRLNSAPSA